MTRGIYRSYMHYVHDTPGRLSRIIEGRGRASASQWFSCNDYYAQTIVRTYTDICKTCAHPPSPHSIIYMWYQFSIVASNQALSLLAISYFYGRMINRGKILVMCWMLIIFHGHGFELVVRDAHVYIYTNTRTKLRHAWWHEGLQYFVKVILLTQLYLASHLFVHIWKQNRGV